jgi:hypothetical protein
MYSHKNSTIFLNTSKLEFYKLPGVWSVSRLSCY